MLKILFSLLNIQNLLILMVLLLTQTTCVKNREISHDAELYAN
jgi:hypothetical protein